MWTKSIKTPSKHFCNHTLTLWTCQSITMFTTHLNNIMHSKWRIWLQKFICNLVYAASYNISFAMNNHSFYIRFSMTTCINWWPYSLKFLWLYFILQILIKISNFDKWNKLSKCVSFRYSCSFITSVSNIKIFQYTNIEIFVSLFTLYSSNLHREENCHLQFNKSDLLWQKSLQLVQKF